jgi:phosphoribosylformimino-5-aminoimidazole carboxamide ribotide isomerase
VRIIGVIDLLGGQAVHARGGCRHGYRPIAIAGESAVNGDAAALARLYTDKLGIRELYLADLDAIAGGTEQDDAVRAVTAVGAPLWLDAAVATVPQAKRALARGATVLVVGLETLRSFAALRDIVNMVSSERVAFSLDLRDGRPIAGAEPLREMSADAIAASAVDAGAGSIIVLDVGRVGSGRGVDLALLGRVKRVTQRVPLLAGGGISSGRELGPLADAGCDGVLMATALHGPGGIELVRTASDRFPITST